MDIQEQIERYILGTLDAETLADFERRLTDDPDFAHRVEQESLLIKAIQLAPKVDAFRTQLKAAQERARATQPPIAKSFRILQLSAIAAVALLLLAALWFFNRPQPAKQPDLFAAHFKPNEAINKAIRGNSANQDSSTFNLLWNAADADLKAGSNEAAISKYDQLISMPEGQSFADDLQYAKGLACLQAGRALEAVASFETIQASFPTEKPWYLALAHYKAGNYSTARQLLQQITLSASPYAAEAKALLHEMGEK